MLSVLYCTDFQGNQKANWEDLQHDVQLGWMNPRIFGASAKWFLMLRVLAPSNSEPRVTRVLLRSRCSFLVKAPSVPAAQLRVGRNVVPSIRFGRVRVVFFECSLFGVGLKGYHIIRKTEANGGCPPCSRAHSLLKTRVAGEDHCNAPRFW